MIDHGTFSDFVVIALVAIAVFGLIALVYGAGVMVDRWFGWWGR
jgi:fatty acid desaturase